MTPPSQSKVIDDLLRSIETVEWARGDSPAGIVRQDLVPRDRAFAMQTTRGVYVLVHPETVDRIAAILGFAQLTAVHGIPVLDELPDDADPLGVEVAWESIAVASDDPNAPETPQTGADR